MEEEGNMTPEELAIKNVGKQVSIFEELDMFLCQVYYCLIGSKTSLGRESGHSNDNQHSAMSRSYA